MPIHGYLGGVISATAPSVTTAGASGVFTLEEQLQASAQNNWPGYQISRSLRFRASAGAYLNRTFTTPTNGKIWTFSTWFKLGNGQFGPGGNLLGTADNGGASGNYVQLGIDYTNGMMYINDYSSGTAIYVTSSNLLRDSSAWYHLMYVYDSTQATAANRIIYYINGVQVTSYSNTTYPSQNYNTYINNSGQLTYFGANYGGSVRNFIGSYFADSYFIDGQALTPTSFGAFDAVTGVWNPKKYTGTYGNNGFYLNYSDPTSATTLVYDYSGNSNNWTANNISVTAGTTYDSMVDVPIGYGSDTGVGGELRGNYCTFNPLFTGGTLASGNLDFSASAAVRTSLSTIAVPTSGKWYWEVTVTAVGNSFQVGIGGALSSGTNYLGSSSDAYSYSSNALKYNNNSSTSYGATYTTNDVIAVAYDADAGTLVFYKNNTSQGTAFSSLSGTFFPAVSYGSSSGSGSCSINFGQRAFSYTAPSGYKALCTQNLPTATVSNGANHMAATIWTGNGASSVTVNNSVNSISFQPDFVWAKNRTTAVGHSLYDSIRGAGANTELNSASTNAEGAGNQDQYGYLSAFNSNGFTGVNGSSSPNYYFNESGSGFVGWQWKGGGTAVTNTAGSITSSVSANPTAGFSVLTYTGTIANATVGHGLGVAPKMIIARNRTNVVNWIVYHASLTSASYYLTLDETNGQTSNSIFWQGVAPTSTVFSLGANSSCNGSTSNIAYCFAPIAGYSAFISYTGNGSGDGPFVYCGFRPRYLMIKRYDAAGDPWWVIDSSRSPYNQTTLALRPNAANAEDSGGNANFDFLANGFKARTSGGGNGNESGATYIVAAFAENPFNISRAR